MAKIGISLPPDYLSGDLTADPFVDALGSVNEALPRLKDAGAESIELRMVRPTMDPDMVKRALERVRQHGLGFTVHGLLAPEDALMGTIEGFPLWSVADWIKKEQGDVVVTVHARWAPSGEVSELAQKTEESLRCLLSEIDSRQAPFRIALEINRSKKKVDPTFTWEGVTSIVEAVDHPSLGICWDMGHAAYNIKMGLIPQTPPENFLKRVWQTHIHDMSAEDKTHWPLRAGKVPVREFCELLVKHDYKGVYNLEIAPNRFFEDPDLSTLLYDSVRKLRSIVKSVCSEIKPTVV